MGGHGALICALKEPGKYKVGNYRNQTCVSGCCANVAYHYVYSDGVCFCSNNKSDPVSLGGESIEGIFGG